MGQLEKRPRLKAILFCPVNFLSLSGEELEVSEIFKERDCTRLTPTSSSLGLLSSELSASLINPSIPLAEVPLCFSNSPLQDCLPWHSYVGWNALSEGLQYGFTDGKWITAREILFHPYSLAVPDRLLPHQADPLASGSSSSSIWGGGASSSSIQSFLKLFPGFDFPVWGGLRSAELILASVLVRASDENLELLISQSSDRKSNRLALPLKKIDVLPGAIGSWKLEPKVDSEKNPGGDDDEIADPDGEGHCVLRFTQNVAGVFQCFALDQRAGTLRFHAYDESISLVNEHINSRLNGDSLADIAARVINGVTNKLTFSLTGHSFIQETCQALDEQLESEDLGTIQRFRRQEIPENAIFPQIWIDPNGSIQFCRKFSFQTELVEVWNFPQEASILLKGLNYGLSATLPQKNPHLVQSRRGIKRDRDLKVLRHVGFFAYLLFETAKFLQKSDAQTSTQDSSQPSDKTSAQVSVKVSAKVSDGEILEFFNKLMIQLGSLLYKIEKKAGLISLTVPQPLDKICSQMITDYIREYVFRLVREVKSGKDSIFNREGEFSLVGGTKGILSLIYGVLSRVAIQSRGECFLKTRLSLFSSFVVRNRPQLQEKFVHFSRNKNLFSPLPQSYPLSNSPWLHSAHVLHALLPLREKGFELFYKRLPLSQMDINDFRPEFRLTENQDLQSMKNEEAIVNTAIDWFELHPHLFFKGIEIDPLQLERLSNEGVLEFQGKVYLIQNRNLPSVKRLETFWSKIQQTQGNRGKAKNSETFLRLPRSQILEMLALRASGVAVKSNSVRWLKICRFYDSLNEKRTPLTIPPTICTELKPYQKQGVQWLLDLYDLGLGGILGDDMGLGKTIQTLVFLEILRCRDDLGLVLILVPTSLTYNWMAELKRFAPEMPAQIFQSKLKSKIADSLHQNPSQVLICTYGLFTEHQEFFESKKWNILIFDEAQNLKNITSKRTTASRSVQARFKACLTGTPLENHLGEFFSLLDLAVSGSLGDLSSFREKFVTPEMSNPEDIKYLRLKIKPLILRRTKSEVLAELPPKTESTIKLPFEQKQEKIYRDIALSWNEKVKDSILNQGESKSQLLMLTALLRLRQACSDPGSIPHIKYTEEPPKITVLMEALEEITESGESALVFTQFLHTFERIKKELGIKLKVKTFSLHGGTSRVERERILREFQETPTGSVLLMTLKTGGVGLNLTKASYVFHLEPWWNPAVEDQATDRTHRMGQQKPVQVYRYLMRESVEEKIEILKARKLAKFNALFMSVESSVEPELAAGGNHLSQSDFEYLLSI